MKLNVFNVFKFIKSEKTLVSATYLFLFVFSLAPFLESLFLIIVSALSLFHIKTIKLNKKQIKVIFSLSFLLFLYFMGCFYSPNKDRAFNLLIRLTPVFFLPILICLSRLHLMVNPILIRKRFVEGVILSSFLSILVASYKAISEGGIHHFFYYELGSFVHLHPTYYALYVLTAIVFLIQIKKGIILRLKIIILVFLSTFVLLLQTKTGVLILLLLYVVFFFFQKNNFKTLVFPFSLFLILFLVGISFEKNRINDLFVERDSIEIGNTKEDGVSQRAWLWTNALNQLKERPFFGYGFGSQQNIFRWKIEMQLLKVSSSNQFKVSAKEIARLNLHNQYLQVLYEFGFVGFLLFLMSIVILAVMAIKGRKHTFLTIYFIFAIFLCTENLLDRQMGIYFYAFILPILYFAEDPVDL